MFKPLDTPALPFRQRKANHELTVEPVDVWFCPQEARWHGICPECETSVNEDMTVCPLCGARLDWEGNE